MQQDPAEPLALLSDDVLFRVAGGSDPGYAPVDNARGRVGPGRHVKWLGNYYTPEALAHDNAVRSGGGGVMAHIRALPLLLPAARSYFRARFNPNPDDRQIPD